MSTYLIMQTRILDEMVNESVTTAQVKLAIQSAISHYERQRFFFNESRSETFSTVASQELYGTADNANIPNLSRIDSLEITVNSVRYPLTKQPWEWFERISSTTSNTGQPTDYCYYAKQIRLYSIPDAAYTVRISGLVRLTTLSADADTNAWMTDGEALIRGRAKWDLGLNVVYSPEIKESGAELESAALRVLNRETVSRLSARLSGSL